MRVTTDYYAVLGVRRDASADQIKMAYRRLARELHPDVNPDPVTHERFKEITQAHEVLSDPGHQVVTYAAWLVPTSGLLYGAQIGYPPSKMPLPGWQWARREQANGAKVPHTPGKHNRVNLVVVLGLSSGVTNGQAAGIDIRYHVGGSHYHLRTATRLDVQVGEAGTC